MFNVLSDPEQRLHTQFISVVFVRHCREFPVEMDSLAGLGAEMIVKHRVQPLV